MRNVLQTSGYSQFRLVSTNRVVDHKHVKRLKAAITKNNLLHLNPILVNSHMEVIDGQHRLNAARELGVPIFYVMDNGIRQEDIATLNSNKKNWAMEDYIHYYAKNGNPAYQALQIFIRNNHFIPPSVAVSIAAGDVKAATLRDGNIKEVNLDEAEAFMLRISDYRNHFKDAYTKKFVDAVKSIQKVEGFDHNQMIEQITVQPRSLKPCTTTKEYVKNLEEIYNYRKKSRLRFY